MESFNHFGAIANALDDVLGQVVRKTAFDWLANAQSQIRANHQIDTGHMINSGYVVTSQDNTYHGSGKDFPSVEQPPDKHTAYLAFAALYSWYQNYGTSRIPARPFIEPSRETTQPSFERALSRVEDALARAK